MRRTRFLFLTLVLTCSILLAACSGNGATSAPGTSGTTTASTATTSPSGVTTSTTPAPTTTASQTTATTTIPTTTAPVQTTTAPPTVFNPLSGLPMTDPSRVTMRPVGAMINNIKIANPQIGINSADLYYEMVAEGGITRMLVVFADPRSVPELGSIRSARSDFIDFAGGIDAILVHAGASYAARAQLNKQKTAHIDMDEVPEAFWRDAAWRRDRGYEHSVKTTGERLTAAIAKLGIRSAIKDPALTAFRFQPYGTVNPPADPAANPATTVTVVFSDYNTATFRYDAQAKLYTKSQLGSVQTDVADGKPLTVTNVFVLRTTIKSIDETVLRDANLTSGTGYYISNGARVPIKWKKGTTNEPFVFTREDGSPLLVNRGKSYVCVQSVSESIRFG